MANTVVCPECKRTLAHERGYLPTHMRDTQRGALVTGTQVCGMSNRKLVTTCRSIRYHAECGDCGVETQITLTEDYPGAFPGPIKPFLDATCVGCTIPEDGYYCESCGVNVKQREESWQAADGEEVRVFETESAALAYVASHPDASGTVERVPAGWYDSDGGSDCKSSDMPDGLSELLDSLPAIERATLLQSLTQGGGTHAGVFKPARTVHLRLHDDYAIREEPDPGEEAEPTETAATDAPLQVCGCCQLARAELPFHHDAHDDSGNSWDYCQECDDAGCDLIDCNVRANPTGGQNG